jgi:hypothetical protein
MAQPEAAHKDLPFAGPAPPDELQVLAPLVGQWTSQSEVRPSRQHKVGFKATGMATGQWLHNRHFLRLEATVTSEKFREEATVLYSYDGRKKIYRRWLFSSSGLATESEGQWNAAKKTMTWKVLHLPPNVAGSVIDVVTYDRIVTTVSVMDADGQVLTDMTVTATRKK